MLSYQNTDSMSKTQHVIWIADAKNRFKDYCTNCYWAGPTCARIGLIKMGSISEAAGPDCEDGGFIAVIDDDILGSYKHSVHSLNNFCYLII